MKLKARYDESIQSIELDEKSAQELWVATSLEGSDLTQDEKEKQIQDEWEIQFNRLEYNSWNKFDCLLISTKSHRYEDAGIVDAGDSASLFLNIKIQ